MPGEQSSPDLGIHTQTIAGNSPAAALLTGWPDLRSLALN